MGSNVVHLTDRKYMMELRRRINEDFNNMLIKRIQNREVNAKYNLKSKNIITLRQIEKQWAKGFKNRINYVHNQVKKL